MTDPTAAPSPWARRGRFAGRWALRVLVAVVGALLAVVLFGRISAPLGPFDASFAFRPSGGGAEVAVPPLGALAVIGAALASLVVYRRRWREPLLAIGITTGLLVTTAGVGLATWRPDALSQ